MGKFQTWLVNFMQGRYGADEFGQALLWMGIALSLIEMFTGWILLGMLSMALFIWAIYRMFSRNTAARSAENTRFLYQWGRVRRSVSQFVSRVRHAKEYKYFKCPQCKAMIRLPKRKGSHEVICPKCGREFKIKVR